MSNKKKPTASIPDLMRSYLALDEERIAIENAIAILEGDPDAIAAYEAEHPNGVEE